MSGVDQTFPSLLRELHRIEIECGEDYGIDFMPFTQFWSAEENAEWFTAWTRNEDFRGAEYRVFGKDGSGGLAALWLVRRDKPLPEQPIVFFGSEGELGVAARDVYDYLWLLAAGVGPYEGADAGRYKPRAMPAFTAFAEKHALERKRSVQEIIAAAKAEFPTFEEDVRAKCKD